MQTELPQIVTIKKIIKEAPGYKTFIFKEKIEAEPGQFVMLWVPELDAKPFSIFYADKNEFAITFKKVGPFTKKMFNLKTGEQVGIFGPYGNSFKLKNNKKILLVGGGCGAPPVAFLASEAVKKKIKVDFVIAGKDKKDILLASWLKKKKINVYHKFNYTPVSLGFKTQANPKNLKPNSWSIFKDLLEKNKYDEVYACGPELLLKKIMDECKKHKVKCQLSLERYMKCGFGVCGQCVLDGTGWRVCKEGPVFTGEQLTQVTEFGKYHRDGTGCKVSY